jgi:carboxypeptidase C (cathepsin A)
LATKGNSPSDPATLTDNPRTWLDFTDLVFIDPIGTGFSRSLVAADQAKREFYSTDNDIHYLSRVIYDWLVKNQRLRSRKYLVGESYGGYRAPRMTHYLQGQGEYPGGHMFYSRRDSQAALRKDVQEMFAKH